MGHTPSTAGEIPKKFRKDPGSALRAFPGIPSRVRLVSPKPYNSRHLRLPEHFQNSLPPCAAGDASFFRSGSGEGLSELVMEFPAVLGVFLTGLCQTGGGNYMSSTVEMAILHQICFSLGLFILSFWLSRSGSLRYPGSPF